MQGNGSNIFSVRVGFGGLVVNKLFDAIHPFGDVLNEINNAANDPEFQSFNLETPALSLGLVPIYRAVCGLFFVVSSNGSPC